MKRSGLSILVVLALLLVACGSATPEVTSGSTESQPTPISVAAQQDQATDSGSQQATPIQPITCELTPADQEGPYYIADAPFKNPIMPDDFPGDRLVVSGYVYLDDCATPLAGAVIDIWQADSKGVYDFSDQFILRGKVKSDESGAFTFTTIVPGYYEPRPLHIHVKVTHPNAVSLTTQIYFSGDARAAGLSSNLLISPSEKDGVLQASFNFILAKP